MKYNAYVYDRWNLSWVWSTKSRWIAPHACTPKAVSLKTAKKQIALEVARDPEITGTNIVPAK